MGAAFGETVEKLRRATVQVKTHGRSSGSGVIWSREGRIITNAHVLEGERSNVVEVELWNGDRSQSTIVTRDRRRDLAVLQIERSGLPAATAADSHSVRTGELVVAVGNPFGFIGAASTGVIHAANVANMSLGGFNNSGWIVSQLRLAPGNSGGPLANADGAVIGINTMIAGGLAFAIPSNSVVQFLKSPLQADSGLGVVVRPVLLEGPGQNIGLVILEVTPHSAADRASLLQGDILLGAAGKRFHLIQDLQTAIHASKGLLELEFRRGATHNVRRVTAQMRTGSMRAA